MGNIGKEESNSLKKLLKDEVLLAHGFNNYEKIIMLENLRIKQKNSSNQKMPLQ